MSWVKAIIYIKISEIGGRPKKGSKSTNEKRLVHWLELQMCNRAQTLKWRLDDTYPFLRRKFYDFSFGIGIPFLLRHPLWGWRNVRRPSELPAWLYKTKSKIRSQRRWLQTWSKPKTKRKPQKTLETTNFKTGVGTPYTTSKTIFIGILYSSELVSFIGQFYSQKIYSQKMYYIN